MLRRSFLTRTAATAGTLLATRSVLPEAEAAAPAAFDPYAIVPLGRTGLKASRTGIGLGFNGSKRQSNHTRMGKERFDALVKGAFDRGVRLFDLADLYGTHPMLLPALRGVPRNQIVIVSKIWERSGGIPETERPPADVVVQRFLKEIGTDYIDIVQMHCMTEANWPQVHAKQLELLEKLKKKGVIRTHGVSCHSLAALKTAASEPWVDTVHARINAFGASMDAPPDQVAPVLQQMHDAGKGVIGMKLCANGKHRDDPERRSRSVEYVLNLGTVDTMIVGFEKEAEIDDFAMRVRAAKKGAAIPA